MTILASEAAPWPSQMAGRVAAFGAEAAVDVLIVGAGINGAGLFRDLTAQGLSVVIADKGDFGGGTSAAPSRLIHGGIKYLETGELRLVAQSTLERNLLLRNAPHYVRPLPTLIPIFSWTKGVTAALRTLLGSKTAPRSRGALLIKAGLAMYDFYGARHRVMPTHRMAGRARSLRDLPALTPAIVATGTYYDATVTHPERLVLELIEDGLADSPRSVAVNHARVAMAPDGRVTVTSALDEGARFTLRPAIVVNAAGPWIDGVNAAFGEASKMIGGTKGSHLLLRHDALLRELKGRMIYFEADDGRICLVFEYLGLAMVGSTDIKANNPDSVRCEAVETDYLLDSLRRLLPKLTFDRSQIVYTYSGIRPLPASDAKDPGLISRDHATPVLEPAGARPFPILSLVGGKWTTFRGYAEEVADMVLGRLGRSRRASTREMAIGGGRDYPRDAAGEAALIGRIASDAGIDRALAEGLFRRYGTRASRIARHIAETGLRRPLVHAPDVVEGEIDFILVEEHVGRLADLALRRTTLSITGRMTTALLDELADLAARRLGWSPARRAEEIAETRTILASRHDVALD
ncbi:glycerol-3-phosphate dehydrogenase/oxidase [Rhizobiales bacterium Sp-1]|uniref:Glycerol-3-phosphate dehydrogenase/oxidase n=2 Tax=Segnochrobactrum spirostomi TaxID=2608987 RepID=A0A6A7Y9S1_9HYPH|nr:glycerol-3-phosphate dehydrogenase/oxidase [Segnochrobactrum spirostomi]